MTRYLKAVVSLLGGLSAWGITAAPDGYTQAELWGLPAVLAVAIGVLAVPNTPPAGQPARRDISEVGP